LKDYDNFILVNKWILNQLNKTVKGVNECFDKYDFGNATIVFHNFYIYDFCDVYIESSKSVLKSN
jgi:valyl-tRNA synthetase